MGEGGWARTLQRPRLDRVDRADQKRVNALHHPGAVLVTLRLTHVKVFCCSKAIRQVGELGQRAEKERLVARRPHGYILERYTTRHE